MHVDLEPQGVEACYRVGQRLSVHVGETAVRRLRTVRPQVGVEQSPGEVLEDTVDHDLHGVDVEASMIVRTGFASQLDQFVDLLGPSMPVPPESGGDTRRERTR